MYKLNLYIQIHLSYFILFFVVGCFKISTQTPTLFWGVLYFMLFALEFIVILFRYIFVFLIDEENKNIV